MYPQVLDSPGLHELLKHLLLDKIENALVLPRNISLKVVDSIPEKLEVQEAPSLPDGVLSITAIEAKQLVNTDVWLLGQRKSDPYAVIEMSVDGVSHNHKSHYIDNCLNPFWDYLVRN